MHDSPQTSQTSVVAPLRRASRRAARRARFACSSTSTPSRSRTGSISSSNPLETTSGVAQPSTSSREPRPHARPSRPATRRPRRAARSRARTRARSPRGAACGRVEPVLDAPGRRRVAELERDAVEQIRLRDRAVEVEDEPNAVVPLLAWCRDPCVTLFFLRLRRGGGGRRLRKGAGKRPGATSSNRGSEVRRRPRRILVVRVRLSRLLVPRVRVHAVVERRARASSACSGWNVSHITASSCVSVIADRLLREPGLRPVRDARRVQRDRADLDPLPRREVARRRNRSSPRVCRFEWWYGIGIASGSKSSLRGQNEQITKFGPANVWCDGGGMWMRPVIGSKSLMLNVHG